MFCLSIHTPFVRKTRFDFALRCCIFIEQARLCLVAFLRLDAVRMKRMLAGERNLACEDSDRLTGREDRDKPEALAVPGAVVCTRLRVFQCERARMCVFAWFPLRLETEGGWKCY